MEALIAALGIAAGAGWGVAGGLTVALLVALRVAPRALPPPKHGRAPTPSGAEADGDITFADFGRRA